MGISRAIAEQMERSSWIRRMFEIGIQLRKERGAENVFDFTLGNPDVEPPRSGDRGAAARGGGEPAAQPRLHAERRASRRCARASPRGLAERTGIPFRGEDVIMTSGAAGAINTVLKSILDPGDEVIVLNPYFPEYRFYIENHGGRVVAVETDERFQPDIARIAAAITPRTKALILNSPNNPTGAVYGAEVLRELDAHRPRADAGDQRRALPAAGLRRRRAARDAAHARARVLAWSWSKAMAIAGERIGYLAIPPHLAEAAPLRNACTFANRILGYINAPAIWQWVVAEVPDATVDVAQYQAKRDLLCDALAAMGYDAPRPQGSFYVFPEDAHSRRRGVHPPAAGRRHPGGPGLGLRPRGLHAAVAHHPAERHRALAAGL